MAFSLETIMDGQLFVTLKNNRMVLGWNTGTVIPHRNDQVTTFSIQNNLQRSPAKMQCILDQITDDQTEFDWILKNSHLVNLRSYFYSDSSLRKHCLLSLACGGFAQMSGELGIAGFDRFDQCFEHSLADIKRGQRKLRRFGASDFQQLIDQSPASEGPTKNALYCFFLPLSEWSHSPGLFDQGTGCRLNQEERPFQLVYQKLCVQRAKEIVRTGHRWRRFFSHNCSLENLAGGGGFRPPASATTPRFVLVR